jgi:hypothetical protein
LLAELNSRGREGLLVPASKNPLLAIPSSRLVEQLLVNVFDFVLRGLLIMAGYQAFKKKRKKKKHVYKAYNCSNFHVLLGKQEL